ncbi:glycosyltransferase family 4 protein [Saccharicrinis aurantiacus]|uniref:glycosyltransferase family 4 protein n=1 Tax=Saccharicrinis aurantiacus TaxID=1849719 RepID=UPI002490165D|nr:glycosyltransferase family 4 protein [Saccharicrinis aurantiacus]
MHIIQIISNLELGGAQLIMLNLSKSLLTQGHKVSIISILNTTKQQIEIPKEISVYTLINQVSLKHNVFKCIYSFYRLAQLIKTLKGDIIHSHLLLAKLFLLNVKNTPIVDTQHDNSPWWYSNDIKSRINLSTEKYFVKNKALHSIAISNSVKDGLIKHCKLNHNKVSTIYNSISIKQDSNTNDKNASAESILFVGRLSLIKKGLDTLVEIAELLAIDFPTLKITIIGDGDDRHKFENMIASKGLEKHFSLLGMQKNVAKFYSKASILIMPSRWEGFGLTAAEAAIKGVPVIASNIGGLNEVVLNNKTGYTVNPENPKEFVDKIKILIKDNKLFHKMSLNAIKSATERFNHDKFANKHVRIYNNYKKKRIL